MNINPNMLGPAGETLLHSRSRGPLSSCHTRVKEQLSEARSPRRLAAPRSGGRGRVRTGGAVSAAAPTLFQTLFQNCSAFRLPAAESLPRDTVSTSRSTARGSRGPRGGSDRAPRRIPLRGSVHTHGGPWPAAPFVLATEWRTSVDELATERKGTVAEICPSLLQRPLQGTNTTDGIIQMLSSDRSLGLQGLWVQSTF